MILQKWTEGVFYGVIHGITMGYFFYALLYIGLVF